MTKRNLLYIRNQSVLRSKHFPTTVIKTKQLMMYKAKVAICSDYYSVVCLTTGPKPPPKRFLHIVRSKASSFK